MKLISVLLVSVLLAWRQGSLAAAARSGYITPAGRERSCWTFRPPQPGSDSCSLVPTAFKNTWIYRQTTRQHNGMKEVWVRREIAEKHTRRNIQLKMDSNPLINGKRRSCCWCRTQLCVSVCFCTVWSGAAALQQVCGSCWGLHLCVCWGEIFEQVLSSWFSVLGCIWFVVFWQQRVETSGQRARLHFSG